jgi:hypothetical protein
MMSLPYPMFYRIPVQNQVLHHPLPLTVIIEGGKGRQWIQPFEAMHTKGKLRVD